MLTQQSALLTPELRSEGCALLCIARAVVNYRPTRVIRDDDLNQIYEEAKNADSMKEGAWIEDWKDTFRIAGLKVNYKGHKSPDYVCGPHEFEFLRFVLPEKGWAHFVIGDRKGNVGWDPWGSAGEGYHTSRTVAEGKLESKRIFSVEGWT